MENRIKPGEIVLQLDPTPENSRHSEGSFITLKSGRIIFAWSRFTSSHSDFGEAVVAARYSDDGGKTWSDQDSILIQKEGTTNVMSVSLLRIQNGKIAILYLRKDGRKSCMPYFRTSDDELETLSEPVSIACEPGYYVVNNDRMIQLKCGRIIFPAALHRYRGPSAVMPGEEPKSFLASPGIILFFFSDDGGTRWCESLTNYYRCFPSGHGLQEPGVIELKDKRLWSWTRPGAEGRQWESFSDDLGQTWIEPVPSQFVTPSSPMQIKRIPPTGDLFAVWNDHSRIFETKKPEPISWGRTPLVCAISQDEGKTWKHHKLLEDSPEHGFCYPAIHFTDDAVLISYCAGGATSKIPLDTLRIRRILIKELYE
ncbi:MAG: glycoside hydrolase [Candidatus Omnitrophica bacterium]|nr:glycoside hydrolase [Candidatus Omnitrophota bacterium]MCM8827948.1 glycoside hydrolase [Candidatus Omnitrophota bacterium]